MKANRLSAQFPVPEFHALCCPHRDKYKMKRIQKPIDGYKCLGDFDSCGKIMTKLEAESFIGMEMVEE